MSTVAVRSSSRADSRGGRPRVLTVGWAVLLTGAALPVALAPATRQEWAGCGSVPRLRSMPEPLSSAPRTRSCPISRSPARCPIYRNAGGGSSAHLADSDCSGPAPRAPDTPAPLSALKDRHSTPAHRDGRPRPRRECPGTDPALLGRVRNSPAPIGIESARPDREPYHPTRTDTARSLWLVLMASSFDRAASDAGSRAWQEA